MRLLKPRKVGSPPLAGRLRCCSRIYFLFHVKNVEKKVNNKQPNYRVNLIFVLTALAILICGSGRSFSQDDGEAFKPIFNEKNLDGWYAIKTYDPRSLLKMDDAAKAKRIADAKATTDKFWRVENGEIVNDGKGPFLTSEKMFGDFELLIEYKTVPLADSGIYL